MIITKITLVYYILQNIYCVYFTTIINTIVYYSPLSV